MSGAVTLMLAGKRYEFASQFDCEAWKTKNRAAVRGDLAPGEAPARRPTGDAGKDGMSTRRVLQAIADAPAGTTSPALCAALGLSPEGLAYHIKKLRDTGCIESARVPGHGSRRHYHLTAEGRAALRRKEPPNRQRIAPLILAHLAEVGESSAGEFCLTYGRRADNVYRAFIDLRGRRLIALSRTGPKGALYYQLTAAGRAALEK